MTMAFNGAQLPLTYNTARPQTVSRHAFNRACVCVYVDLCVAVNRGRWRARGVDGRAPRTERETISSPTI